MIHLKLAKAMYGVKNANIMESISLSKIELHT